MSTYEQVASAIAYLVRHAHDQPSLATVADLAGSSPAHFQRQFRRWAGVSPKRFLAHLTVENAKRRLAESASLLETAYDVGLSGPGRLHDHFVTIEGVTPGECRHRGEGLVIEHGVHPTPFGLVFIAHTARGVCHLEFVDEETDAAPEAMVARDWPAATLRVQTATTLPIIERLFGAPTDFSTPLPLLVKGTNFQIQVWRALLRIPQGSVSTYADVAEAAGTPSAARAVGQAVGANPCAFVIPCHRVLRATGGIGGYRWGVDRKRALLAWESLSTAGFAGSSPTLA